MGVSMGSGSSSTNGYSVTAPPKYISNAYKGIISQAQDTAATPYTPYTGQLTAGLTDAQNTAIAGLGSAQGAYEPYYNQAAQYGQQSTTAINPMEFNAQNLAQYQNPYTQSVVDATLADLSRLFGTQQTQVTGNAISAGAWGGDRAGIVKSNLANNQAQTAATTLANLRSDAYNNAVSQFNTANNAQMGAQQQNNANALAAAGLYQGLGTGASTNAINLNQALMSAGTTQQATEQAGLDAAYQQFLNEQQYPFETLSWLTGIATGVGSNAGGTNIGSSTTSSSGFGGSLSFASGGAAMPYDGTRQAGLSLPIAAPAQGSGPPKAQIPTGEAKIPSVPTGKQDEPSNLQQALNSIKDGIAPIPGVGSTVPNTPASVSGGVAGNPIPSAVGDISIVGKAGLGSVIPFMANGGEVDDEGVPLIFGPDPYQDDGAIKGGLGVDPLPGRPDATPVAGLGAASDGIVQTGGAPVPRVGQMMQAALGAPQEAPQGRNVPRGIRTNNPGNIKDSEFARSMPGYVGSDGVNAIFETPEAGYAAMNKLLDVYGNKHGLNTVSGILGRWAPASADNNDTSGYIGYVAKRLGIDPNAPLTPEARAALPQAMAYFENGREFPMAGNPLAVTDANGRIQMGGNRPQAGLGYASNEDMLPAAAQPTAGRSAPVAGLGAPPAGEPVDEGRAMSAAIQAGIVGLLTTGRVGAAIQAGTQTYNDMQYRLRGLVSPNERMQLLQQQMYQTQADKAQAEVDAQRAKMQMEQQGTWSVVGPVNDAEGNVIGTAVINNRTGEVVTRPIGVTRKAGPEADVEGRKRAAARAGLDPSSPAYQSFILTGKMPREDQAPLTATDKKAILEADEGVLAAETAIENLRKAKELSPKAYAGPFAGQRGYAGSLVGLEGASETVDMDNLIKTNALSQLKSIFGAAPTEGERAILLEIQGSSSLGDKERQKVYDRAIQMAEKRLELNRQRAEELRGGSFYKPKKEGDPLAEAKAAISKGAPRDAVIQRLKERGIDTSGL